ncbi:MAG: hypothetical protein E6G15_09165 [Actinobacteria bacterium]|nr:MAG: hypothetical protein E6G15_09165 [Actinomycetota bacterium]
MGIVLAAVLAVPARASAKSVAVIVVPRSAPVFSAPDAAQGLLIAGEGATVSRRGALVSLLRGELGNSVVDSGIPGGSQKISLARRPGVVTFYVTLPPPGRHHNVVRYPIAVRGPGYSGVVTSSSTHLTGLVSIADVAPSVVALRRGDRPVIRSHAVADPGAYLRDFDRRLTDAHDSRTGALLALVGLMVLLGVAALVFPSAALGRAAFLAAPSCLVVSLLLSAAAVTRPWHVFVALGLGAGALALAGGALLRPRLPLALGLVALFVFFFAALWAQPRWNSLAALGARPDGGGRFYGVNNQIATLLLSPALVLGALSGPALPGVALLVSAGIGVSTIGANGGGLLAFLVGFFALGLLLRDVRPTPAAALALVGIDAALGGSNHVTHAVGGGPGSLAGHFAHRLHLAAAYVAARWNQAVLFTASVAGLTVVALLRPRVAVLDAFLVGLVVLLLVSDNPTDIAGLGALSAIVLRVWLGRTGERLSGLD